jgi:hypothetical protein
LEKSVEREIKAVALLDVVEPDFQWFAWCHLLSP